MGHYRIISHLSQREDPGDFLITHFFLLDSSIISTGYHQ